MSPLKDSYLQGNETGVYQKIIGLHKCKKKKLTQVLELARQRLFMLFSNY